METYKKNATDQFLGLRYRSFVKEYSHFFFPQESLQNKPFSSMFLKNIRIGKAEEYENFEGFNTFLLQQYTLFIEAKNSVWS